MVLFAGGVNPGSKAATVGHAAPHRIAVRMPPWDAWGWPEAFLAQQLKLGPDYECPPISGRYRPMQGGWVANPIFNNQDSQ